MPKAKNYVETYVREKNLERLEEIKKYGWSAFVNDMIKEHGQDWLDQVRETGELTSAFRKL